MSNWIDEVGYPWHIKEAQQLHANLIKLKPSGQMAIHIADKVEIETSVVNPNQGIFFIWKEILQEASTSDLLRPLIKEIDDNLNRDHAMKAFFTKLLAGEPVNSEAEQIDEEGKADFVSGSDEISQDESLLFKEDLTLQIIKLPSLIKALQKLMELSPAVCRLVVGFNGSIQYGTAFRVGSKTLLTNHHVLHSKKDDDPATVVTAQFNYDDEEPGGLEKELRIKLEPATIKANKDNDWAIIMAKNNFPSSIPIISMDNAPTPKKAGQAFIVQHPLGGTKRIGYVRNNISNVNDRVVHYLTDTQEGSSGAPVFDEDGGLIALHHKGGMPVEFTGKTPMKKNEGIRISQVLHDMQKMHIQIE